MIIKCLASGSSGNCYVVSDGTTSVLLDAGIPIHQIRAGTGFSLSAMAGALISHSHGDHCKAVKDLVGIGVDCYGPHDVFLKVKYGRHRCHRTEVMKPFQLGTFAVMPFDVQHDVENYGYLIKSNATGEQLLYFTDTYYLKYTFPGCTHMMCECNYDPEAIDESIAAGRIPIELKKRLVKSHMSVDTLIGFLKANDLSELKQIYLLHLSANNSREDEFKRKIQAVCGCEVYIC